MLVRGRRRRDERDVPLQALLGLSRTPGSSSRRRTRTSTRWAGRSFGGASCSGAWRRPPSSREEGRYAAPAMRVTDFLRSRERPISRARSRRRCRSVGDRRFRRDAARPSSTRPPRPSGVRSEDARLRVGGGGALRRRVAHVVAGAARARRLVRSPVSAASIPPARARASRAASSRRRSTACAWRGTSGRSSRARRSKPEKSTILRGRILKARGGPPD